MFLVKILPLKELPRRSCEPLDVKRRARVVTSADGSLALYTKKAAARRMAAQLNRFGARGIPAGHKAVVVQLDWVQEYIAT